MIIFATELAIDLTETSVAEGNNKEIGQSKTANKSFPGNDKVSSGENCSGAHRY